MTFPHVVLAAYMTGAAFVVGVAFWQLAPTRRRRRGPRRCTAGRRAPAPSIMLVSGLGVAVSGDIQGKIMTEVQPMKMAAAEALYDTEEPAAFSIFTIGTLDGTEEKFSIKIPNLLSFLATGDLGGEVAGHQRAARAVPEDLRRGPGCDVLLRRRLHAEHPAHLLDLPADDRPRARRRPRSRPGSCWATRTGRVHRPGRADPVAGAVRCRSCPCSPTPSAGSSPRWAASRGPSSA